jgi:phage-related protein
MKNWSVEYVELDDKKPFEEFVFRISIKERAKIFETIDYFLQPKIESLPVKANLSKHLDDGIFELRASLRDKIARIFYFYRKEAIVILAHGFIKKKYEDTKKRNRKGKEIKRTILEKAYKMTNYEKLFREQMKDPEFA